MRKAAIFRTLRARDPTNERECQVNCVNSEIQMQSQEISNFYILP
jgi:hypothetical protein